MRFRVWAPASSGLELELRGGRLAMEPEGGGWYQLEADATAGDRYGFCIDGADAVPDPRSLHQPDGVHGLSAVVDHDAFDWSDSAWRGRPLAEAVIYELHIGTFTPGGTFDAAIERLPHLVELGVSAIQLMPVAEFPGSRGWGYDGVDLYAPHHAYGGPDGLKRLVDACHRAGLAVLLDVVYNHLGPDGDYLGSFGPYFTDVYRTPWGPAINYDGRGSDEVRGFVLDNVTSWLRDYHLDGLRLDAVHAIIDTSAVHVIEAIAGRVEELRQELGRELWLTCESDLNDPRLVESPGRGGLGADAQWSDDFHHALHALLSGETAGYYADFRSPFDVVTALREVFVYGGRYSAYRDRTIGRPVGDLPATRFIAFLQNHDQVGNRAAGDRLAVTVSEGRLRMGAALVLLGPFVPLLFMGEEWAASTPFLYFTDHDDAALGRAVGDGRRREFAGFGWDPAEVPDPQDPASAERSRLKWEEAAEPGHVAMLGWYRALLRLRATVPGLADGDRAKLDAGWDPDSRTLTYARAGIIVTCNLGNVAVTLPGTAEVILAWPEHREGQVAPDGVVVWRR